MSSVIGDANGVDLNRASREELERVGGIGSERAERIVRARPLESWDDLRQVEGFDGKLVDDLENAGARL